MSRMQQFFSANFMAPHGYCFLWLPEIVWLHVIANSLIAVAYFSIPIALWRFAKIRPDIPFRRVFLLFATFITLCGMTHVFGIIVLWLPIYGIEGLVMLTTAIASVSTAIFVWRILPSAVTLPSPSQLQIMNAQLNASNEETERKVRERTHELEITNNELMEARRKADEASLAKSEFLANMSHEIRTPMNVVLGLSNILATSEPLTSKQKEFIATLRTSADTLLTLIDDLLDISKIETESVELEEIPFSIVQVIEESATIMKVRAQEKGLTFNIETAVKGAGGGAYLGDPNRLRQIMLNLCSNAIKFTKHGGVSIMLKCEKTDDSAIEKVTVSVKDTGIGIPEDKQETIFDKFVQADSSTSRKYGGSGLGLAITKNLVELMNGSLKVESRVGAGTEFTVTIPLILLVDYEIPQNKDMIVIPADKSAGTGIKRILLVEDYYANVLVATSYLDQLGFESDTASTGLEAIEKFRKGGHDLILMDVQMPKMNGLETTLYIRQYEAENGLSCIPIIGLTAHALSEDRKRCLEAGMDDYLSKPYTLQDLQSKITNLQKKL